MADYARFCICLCNGGELDGVRILSRKTCEWMRSNHLPGGADMGIMAGEAARSGVGFGLGFSVVEDPETTGHIISKGSYSWAGTLPTYLLSLSMQRWSLSTALISYYNSSMRVALSVRVRVRVRVDA